MELAKVYEQIKQFEFERSKLVRKTRELRTLCETEGRLHDNKSNITEVLDNLRKAREALMQSLALFAHEPVISQIKKIVLVEEPMDNKALLAVELKISDDLIEYMDAFYKNKLLDLDDVCRKIGRMNKNYEISEDLFKTEATLDQQIHLANNSLKSFNMKSVSTDALASFEEPQEKSMEINKIPEDTRQLVDRNINNIEDIASMDQIKEAKEGSHYHQLYESLYDMYKHGQSISDERSTNLAKELTKLVHKFESSPGCKDTFRKNFLDKLHSEDKHFAVHRHNPIKRFLGAIYKSLYSRLFDRNNKHVEFKNFTKKLREPMVMGIQSIADKEFPESAVDGDVTQPRKK